MNYRTILTISLLAPMFIYAIGINFFPTEPRFKVGECVRELGFANIETITYITEDGLIETMLTTSYENVYGNVYDSEQRKKLIKVKCEE